MAQIPLIDEQNPFYCPTVPAISYLDSLRQLHAQENFMTATQDSGLFYSFAHIIDQQNRLAIHSDDDDSSPGTHPIPAWEKEGLSDLSDRRPPVQLRSVKRKLSFSSSFSDIKQPAKYARSFQSVHDSSFELSVKAQRLFYFDSNPGYSLDYTRPGGNLKPDSSGNGDTRILEDELSGPLIGTETPRSLKPLITRLGALFPGIRLTERLQDLDDPTHQKIADILAENGLLDTRVLDVLRTSKISSLSLSASLLDEGGLNLSGRDILHGKLPAAPSRLLLMFYSVFNKPHSFLFLSELSFSDTPIEDFDLVHIHHLPRLASLMLDNTGIGNEAIFLLTSLKRSLYQLCISSNPRIGNYAVPALLLLSKLSFLSILDTNIDMTGLRHLATTIHKEDRVIGIEIPAVCEYYLDHLDSKYLVYPSPPLIVKPSMCAQLSATVLRRNLAEHAKCNPDISTSGTKAEMANRLGGILKIRQVDLLAREMIWG